MLCMYFGNRADRTPATADTYRINELMRFRIILGGLGASACMGTFYGFNIISTHMMTEYGFTSQGMTTITTVGVAVGFFTLPGGMLLDFAGPMYVCMCALLLNALGSLLFALAFDNKIAGSVVRFSAFCAIMNLGCASFDTGCLMAVMGSFPNAKGSVVAILKTFTGLVATIFAVINLAFFREKFAAYMYFMTIVIVAAGSLAVVLIRFPPHHIVDCEKRRLPAEVQMRRRLTEKAYLTQRPPMQRFYYGYTVTLLLVAYLTTQSLCGAYVPSMTDGKRAGIGIGCIVLVFGLTLIAAPVPFLGGMSQTYSADLPVLPVDACEIGQMLQTTPDARGEVEQDQHALDDNFKRAEPVVYDDGVRKVVGSVPTAAVSEDVNDNNRMLEANFDPQYQGTFWQNLRQVDIWLCWWNTLATWGCGVVISLNSAQIYRALSDGVYDYKLNTLYSAFIGIGSALGRMSLGIFEMWLISRPVEGRLVITCVYPVASTCMVLGLIFLIALPLRSKAVIIGFFLDAFGNGFSWASTAITIRTMFAKDIGKHYNFMYLGGFVAIIALNRFAYGEVYDRAARRQRDAGGKIYPFCAGHDCVRIPFGVLIAVNASAIVGSTLCHLRYRQFVHAHRAERKARLAASQGSTERHVSTVAHLYAVDM